jgi:hypothetical protein
MSHPSPLSAGILLTTCIGTCDGTIIKCHSSSTKRIATTGYHKHLLFKHDDRIIVVGFSVLVFISIIMDNTICKCHSSSTKGIAPEATAMSRQPDDFSLTVSLRTYGCERIRSPQAGSVLWHWHIYCNKNEDRVTSKCPPTKAQEIRIHSIRKKYKLANLRLNGL